MALTTHIYTHLQDTTAATERVCYGEALEKCMHVYSVCVWLYLAHIALQIHTNVFISTRPVKMSSLCLFSPHSE